MREKRSNFEETVAKQLRRKKIRYRYEADEIEYIHPVVNGQCADCGSVHVGKTRRYTPDYSLPDSPTIFLEAKGRFTSVDRSKHIAIKRSRPDIEIRFVFMQDKYLTKAKKHRYTDWCKLKGIKCAVFPKLPI